MLERHKNKYILIREWNESTKEQRRELLRALRRAGICPAQDIATKIHLIAGIPTIQERYQ